MIFFKGENMTAGYGGADIIKNCNIQVKEGEIEDENQPIL